MRSRQEFVRLTKVLSTYRQQGNGMTLTRATLRDDMDSLESEIATLTMQIHQLSLKIESSSDIMKNAAKHQETCQDVLTVLSEPLRFIGQALDKQVPHVSI
jgi:chromosome segregation ATPase